MPSRSPYWRHLGRSALLLAYAGFGGLAGVAGAQEVPATNDEIRHWAMAPFLGTGAYQFDDEQTVYVIEYTPRWTWREASAAGEAPRRIGLDVLVPATIGLRNFDLGDLPETLDPGNAATLSVVPGVYATLELNPQWTLLGIANLGLGARLDGGETALIHRFGLRARYRIGDEERRWNFIAGIEQIGFKTDLDHSGRLLPVSVTVELELAIDAWPGKAGPTYLIPHVSGSHYLDELSVTAIEEATAAIRNDLEIGLAVRPAEPFRLWRLSWERIGIAYRRGEGESDFEGIRLFFGSAFDD